MSQFTGLFSGQFTEYTQGVYGRLGYAPVPNADISVNPLIRGPEDRVFYWDPSEPTEWVIPASGLYTGGKFEITDIAYYEIGITPDLGWATPEMMLQEYSPDNPYSTNTQLYIESNLSVNLNTATLDSQLSLLRATVDQDEFTRLLFTNYTDFIWSVRSVTKYGQRSRWARPRRFVGSYEVAGSFMTVENIPAKATKRHITIKGTRNPSILKVKINGDDLTTRYPESNTWEADFLLSGGTNNIYIRGYNEKDRPTRQYLVSTLLETGSIQDHKVFNTFDEFGLLVGIDRIYSTGESNDNLRKRIEDVFIHKSSPDLAGLHNSISRNLDLDYHDYALKIRPSVIQFDRSDDIYGPLYIDINTDTFDIAGTGFRVFNEHQKIDVQSLKAYLNNKIDYVASEESIEITDGSGQRIPNYSFSIDIEDNSINFHEHHMADKNIWITYSKKLSTPIGSSVTLQQLANSIANLKYGDRQILNVDVASGYGSKSSDGLIRGRFLVAGNSRFTDGNTEILGVPIRWSDVSLFSLVDYKYHDRYLNENGNNLNTKIDAFVDSFKNKAHLSWDKVNCDEDVWDPIDEATDNAAHIRFTSEPVRGYWKSSSPLQTGRFSTAHAAEMMFKSELDKSELSYHGIRQSDFKSGIGRDEDLKVVISDQITKEVLYSPGVYRVTTSIYITGSSVESRYLPDSIIGGSLFTP